MGQMTQPTVSSTEGQQLVSPVQTHQTKVKWSKYNFFKHLHSTIKSKDTEVLGGLTARPNEIKPDLVDQPERTAHYDCVMRIAEMLHNTIAQRQFC